MKKEKEFKEKSINNLMMKKIKILSLFFAFFYYIIGGYLSILIFSYLFPSINIIIKASISIIIGYVFGFIGYRLGGGK